MNKRTIQRMEIGNRNNEILKMIKEKLPSINIDSPKQRVSTVIEEDFARDLLEYARKQGMSSRSDLIAKILIEWWEKESMVNV